MQIDTFIPLFPVRKYSLQKKKNNQVFTVTATVAFLTDNRISLWFSSVIFSIKKVLQNLLKSLGIFQVLGL